MAPRTGLPRPLAIPLALLLGVVLCELLLRGASLFVSGERDRELQPLGPDGQVVVCMGDSNTFGLYEEAEAAYPGVLDALLDARTTGGPHRVLNLGIPGLNSRQVLENLPAVLDEHDPDLVLVVIGINNVWSWRDESDVDYGRPWYESLRLAKLLRIADQRIGSGDVSTGTEAGGHSGTDRSGRSYTLVRGDLEGERDEDGLEEGVRSDLLAIERLVSAAGARLVLLGYAFPEGTQRKVNGVLGEVAAETGCLFIDGAAALVPWAQTYGSDRLFYADTHPTALGYELYARHAFNRLLEAGLFTGEPVSLAADLEQDPARTRAPGRITVALEEPVLEVTGAAPGVPIQLMLSRQGEGPLAHLPGVVVPLVRDALFTRCGALPALGTTTDGSGGARVDLRHAFSAEELEALAGRELHAAYLLMDTAEPTRVRAASAAFAIRF